MKKYKYISQRKNKYYRFELIPPNNNEQPIGVSSLYNTYEECEKARRYFSGFVKTHKLNSEKTNYVEIYSDDLGRYYFGFIDSAGNIIFYREKGYWDKTECKRGIDRVYRAFFNL